MVFVIKNILFLCCLLILLTIVMPINCNKFNSKINQSRYKRFPRQVNANNDQQFGANDTASLEKKNNFGITVQSGFDALNQGVKDAMHHKSNGRTILPDRNNERRGRQLNIYSPAQGSNNYNYQDYMSQPWYLANKEYYDKYYANYYQSYYQTSTEFNRVQYQQPYSSQVTLQSNPQSHINQQYQQPQPSQVTSTSNLQSLPNRLNNIGTSTNDEVGEPSIYIDENGLFQIGKSNEINMVSPVIDDDAIVFQSDESQYNRRANLFNEPTRMNMDSNSKINSFNGQPVFSS